jgi:hypothetical protein
VSETRHLLFRGRLAEEAASGADAAGVVVSAGLQKRAQANAPLTCHMAQ